MKNISDAIIQVESQGYDDAIGDKDIPLHAYGPMQIRQTVCDDVNKRYGTNFRAESMQGRRSISLGVFYLYMSIYATSGQLGRMPTDEDRARIWNGGPSAWNPANAQYAHTTGYWAKVQAAMNG